MYSELTQQLDRVELESLTESLEVAIATHLDWLANVNKALVCNDKQALDMCPKGEAYKKCQFGRWYYRVTNPVLITDDVFHRLGQLHMDMHIKVNDLIEQQSGSGKVAPDSYQEFIELQGKFFDVLKRLTKDSTESLGNIDFLTGLPNRRAFNRIVTMENNRIQRFNTTSTIAIADIDYFKKINDTYGHDAGDRVLTQVAEIFQSNIRQYDTVSRFGGEEFVFCLPEIEFGDANTVLERTRVSIEENAFDIDADEPIQLTCSFGASQFNRDFAATEAMTLADESLYEAKTSGRNRVVHHVSGDDCHQDDFKSAING